MCREDVRDAGLPGRWALRGSSRVRNVIFAVLGAFVLVLKPAYRGPFEGVARAYVGNVSVSFALYFAAVSATAGFRRPRPAAAALTLIAVEAFELTDGFFGAMGNVFDPYDLLANAIGVGLAVVVDVATARPPASQGRQKGVA
jgi:hypothetical protein